jgi:hypothetical protein
MWWSIEYRKEMKMKAIKIMEEMKIKVFKAVVLSLLIVTLFFAASTSVYAADNDPSIRIEQANVNGSYKLVVTATASTARLP